MVSNDAFYMFASNVNPNLDKSSHFLKFFKPYFRQDLMKPSTIDQVLKDYLKQSRIELEQDSRESNFEVWI